MMIASRTRLALAGFDVDIVARAASDPGADPLIIDTEHSQWRAERDRVGLAKAERNTQRVSAQQQQQQRIKQAQGKQGWQLDSSGNTGCNC